jgi:hypothetical protein
MTRKLRKFIKIHKKLKSIKETIKIQQKVIELLMEELGFTKYSMYFKGKCLTKKGD